MVKKNDFVVKKLQTTVVERFLPDQRLQNVFVGIFMYFIKGLVLKTATGFRSQTLRLPLMPPLGDSVVLNNTETPRF